MGFTLVLCEASYILNYIILIINLKKTNTMTTYYLQQKNGNDIITLATAEANGSTEASKIFTQRMRSDRNFAMKVEQKVNTKWTKIFAEGFQK